MRTVIFLVYCGMQPPTPATAQLHLALDYLRPVSSETRDRVCRFQVPLILSERNETLAWEHYQFLRDQSSLNADNPRWPDFREEAYRRYRCWYCLAGALRNSQHEYQCQFCLERLRKVLEDDRLFDLGLMPEPIPYYLDR